VKTLVVGATGVLGRRVVPLLVAAGHDVTAAARSDARARLLEELGASPVRVDVFDPAAVRKVVAGHEVVVNLATHIPPTAKMAMPGAWAENDRIRTEVSRHLVDAVLAENTVLSENTALSENTVLSENTALSGNSVRYVQESIAFVYRDGRDQWLDESSPVDPVANLASATVAEANAARVTAAGATGVILRFATFYGSDSGSSLAMIRLARRRIALGAGPDRYVSSITTDDAAAAVVASLSAPAGLYNVGDDEPMTSRDFFAALAGALGVRPPFIAPVGLAKLGGPKASVLVRSQRVSSGAFVEATGWKPEYRSVREGWPAVLAAITAQGAS
jgi:nucleoside-diphosphate-sugar epimerase